jgi:hypothetical protein
MKTSVKALAFLVFLALATGLPLTTVAQSPYTPTPGSSTPSIAGTTWAGPDTHGRHYVYEFRADGAMHYTYENGSFTDGFWKQDGDSIYMSINNKFSERKGRITGSHMEGDAWNVKGEKWTWIADKK